MYVKLLEELLIYCENKKKYSKKERKIILKDFEKKMIEKERGITIIS